MPFLDKLDDRCVYSILRDMARIGVRSLLEGKLVRLFVLPTERHQRDSAYDGAG